MPSHHVRSGTNIWSCSKPWLQAIKSKANVWLSITSNEPPTCSKRQSIQEASNRGQLPTDRKPLG